MYDKIKCSISSVNCGYPAMNKMFTSKLLSKDTKTKLNISYLPDCHVWM